MIREDSPAAASLAASGSPALSPAFDSPALIPLSACIISAMPEEMEPMRALLANLGAAARELPSPIGTLTLITFPAPAADSTLSPELHRSELYSSEPHSQSASASGTTPAPEAVLLAVTGIGFTATASCLGWILAHFSPEAIVSIGSAGGLSPDSRVRDVVLGTRYRDGFADGTNFGYVRGQVPGQPEYFSADPALLAAGALVALNDDAIDIRTAEMLSSDTFVTDVNVGDIREAFPAAVSADMESYPAAHVAHQWGIPFLSVRAISDLCSTPEDQTASFHAELAEVAGISAHVALATLRQAEVL